MPIRVDSKGNITFEPDDIPAEPIIVPEPKIQNPMNIPGIDKPWTKEELEKADSIPAGRSPEEIAAEIGPESEPTYKKVETPMLNNYGEMTKEEMFICFYNREKPRCADADDESLARMLKEIRLMGEILRIREHCIIQEDNERETKRSRKQREARRLLDAEYKPKTNIQKTAEQQAEETAKKILSKREKAIQVFIMGMGISRERAEAIYDKGEIE